MSNRWDRGNAIVIGIGSPHGDDQFGWAVIDHLASMELSGLKLLKIGNPLDLILELEKHERVILVDACVGLTQSAPFLKINYTDAKDQRLIQEIPRRSTHDLGVYTSLRLAESLGKPTGHVLLWIHEGESFGEISEMGSSTAVAAFECAVAIAGELCDARNVPC